MRGDLGQFVTHVGVFDLYLRQASEQYSTCAQFLAHALRHVMSRPQVLQGLLGKLCLLPLNVFFCDTVGLFNGWRAQLVDGLGEGEIFVAQTRDIVCPNAHLQVRVAQQHFRVMILCLG